MKLTIHTLKRLIREAVEEAYVIRAELDHLNYYYCGDGNWGESEDAVVFASKAKAKAELSIVIQTYPCEISPDDIEYNIQRYNVEENGLHVIDKDDIGKKGYVYVAAATIKGMNDLYFGKGVWGPLETAEFRPDKKSAEGVLELAMDDFPAEYEVDFNNLFSYNVVPQPGSRPVTKTKLS